MVPLLPQGKVNTSGNYGGMCPDLPLRVGPSWAKGEHFCRSGLVQSLEEFQRGTELLVTRGRQAAAERLTWQGCAGAQECAFVTWDSDSFGRTVLEVLGLGTEDIFTGLQMPHECDNGCCYSYQSA